MEDRRRPREVFLAFCEQLGDELTPLGFRPTKKGATLTRKVGTLTQRVEVGSSHYNSPGKVEAWITLSALDKTIDEHWRAGGGLHVQPFADEIETNVADAKNAAALIAHVRRRLSFFELLEDPAALLLEVRRRYVGGLLEPSTVVPYLRARLGREGVASYAHGLLDGRNELWPSFLGAPVDPSCQPDHGTSLARAIAADGIVLVPPADAVVSEDARAANLRSFLGLQLRAWGEKSAAAELRGVDDEGIRALHARFESAPGPVYSLDKVRAVLGRSPQQSAAIPRLFQYCARHARF